MNKLRLILKVSRPIFWPIGLLLFLSGLIYGRGTLSLISVIQMICLSFPLALFTFGINDINDYESDRINPRKGTAQGMILDPKNHKMVWIVSFCAAIIVMASSAITLNTQNILCMFLLLSLLYLYSSRPVRLKVRPPFDSLSNGLMVLLTFTLGYSFSGPVTGLGLSSLLIALCVSGIHAYTTILDYPYDKKANTRTFAVAFGKRTAAIFPLCIFLITLLVARFSLPITAYLVLCLAFFAISSVWPAIRLSRIFSRAMFIGSFIFGVIYIYMKIFK
jgi:4-hydroxybenzoate polyprenyltransferase